VLDERGFELAGDRSGELSEIDLLGTQLERSGFQFGEVQQVDRELAQTLDLIPHLIQEPPPRLRVQVLVLEQLQEPTE